MSRPLFEALLTTQVKALGSGPVAPGHKSNLMTGSTSGVPGSCTNPSCVEPSKSLRNGSDPAPVRRPPTCAPLLPGKAKVAGG